LLKLGHDRYHRVSRNIQPEPQVGFFLGSFHDAENDRDFREAEQELIRVVLISLVAQTDFLSALDNHTEGGFDHSVDGFHGP
jgi:hypothetical protein